MLRSLLPSLLAGPLLAACMGPAASPVIEMESGLLYAGAEQDRGQVAMQAKRSVSNSRAFPLQAMSGKYRTSLISWNWWQKTRARPIRNSKTSRASPAAIISWPLT